MLLNPLIIRALETYGDPPGLDPDESLTYAFFLLFAVVKLSTLYLLISVEAISLAAAMPQIWDKETQALFAAVMSFWFGARMFSKKRG